MFPFLTWLLIGLGGVTLVTLTLVLDQFIGLAGEVVRAKLEDGEQGDDGAEEFEDPDSLFFGIDEATDRHRDAMVAEELDYG